MLMYFFGTRFSGRHYQRTSWSTDSNAAFRSRYRTKVGRWEECLCSRICRIVNIQSMNIRLCLKPAWFSCVCYSRDLVRRRSIIEVNIYDAILVEVIPVIVMRWILSFLINWDRSQLGGITLSSQILAKIVKITAKTWLSSLKLSRVSPLVHQTSGVDGWKLGGGKPKCGISPQSH